MRNIYAFNSAAASIALLSFTIICWWLLDGDSPQLFGMKSNGHHPFPAIFIVVWWSESIVKEIAYRRYALTPMQSTLPRNWDFFVAVVFLMYLIHLISLHVLIVGVTWGILATFASIQVIAIVYASSTLVGVACLQFMDSLSLSGLFGVLE